MAKFESMQSVFRSNLKPRARLVLQCLVLHGNQAGECFPSIKTIAAECGYGVSTVKRALDELLEAGYIQKEARFDTRKNGGQTSNLYTLCTVLPEPPVPQPEKVTVEEAAANIAETSAQEAEQEANHLLTPREMCAHSFVYSFAEGIRKSAERLCPTLQKGSPKSDTAFWGEEAQRSGRAFAACGETSGAQFATTRAGGQPIFVPP